MACYLRKHFETLGDSSKEHYLVDEADTANIRRIKQGEHVRKPCRCYNIIAVDKFGNFTKLFDFKDIEPKKLGVHNELTSDIFIDEDDSIGNEDEAFCLNHDTIYELAEPGTFIGLRSPSNALESFFVAEVKSKDAAGDDLIDKYGHSILKGENYLEVSYLEKIDGKIGKNVKYRYPRNYSDVVYLHIGEVFITNINLQNLQMDIKEYQSILTSM